MEYLDAPGVQVEVGDIVNVLAGYYSAYTIVEVSSLRKAVKVQDVQEVQGILTLNVPVEHLSLIRKPHGAPTQEILTVPQETLHLLIAGKVFAEDVTILGFYKELPKEISVASLGLIEGGIHYKALANAFGIAKEELRKLHVRNEFGLKEMRVTFLRATEATEPSIGWARLVSIKDGVAYTVSNAYNF